MTQYNDVKKVAIRKRERQIKHFIYIANKILLLKIVGLLK